MQYGSETVLTILDRKDMIAKAADAALLGGDVGQRWVRLRGLRHLVGDEKKPIAYSEIFINDLFRSVANHRLSQGDTYFRAIIERHNQRLVGIDQEITGLAITGQYAKALDVPPDSPGLKIIRQYIGHGGTILEVTINTHPASRFAYRLYLNKA
jgi:DNA-binding GntR family transcriptional regulator